MSYLSIEECSNCEVEVEVHSILDTCQECGAKVVACHACQSWKDQDTNPCVTCISGSNFKEVK